MARNDDKDPLFIIDELFHELEKLEVMMYSRKFPDNEIKGVVNKIENILEKLKGIL